MSTSNIEEANVLAGLTEQERTLSAGDEPEAASIEHEQPIDELRTATPPILIPKPIDNAQEIAARLAAYEDDLAVKFDDGDITAREYRDGLAQVAAQRDELRWADRKADLAREMRTTAENAAWQREVNDFMTKGPGAKISSSRAAMVAFDEHVKRVTADPTNARLSDRAQLQKAYAAYKRDMAGAGLSMADDGLDTAYALGGMGGAERGGDFDGLD